MTYTQIDAVIWCLYTATTVLVAWFVLDCFRLVYDVICDQREGKPRDDGEE